MRRRDWMRRSGGAACALALPMWVKSGHAAEPGITSASITIGSSLPLSGILAAAGKEHTAGIQAAFKAVNAAGGIAGRELKLLTVDDGYVPARTGENVKRLIDEQSAFALLSTMGTGNTAAAVPLVEAAGVPLVGPVTGAASLRQPQYRQVFHVRASYRDEITRLLQQMLSWGLQQVAMVYLDNAFGKEVLRDAEAALQQRGVKVAGAYALAADGSNGEALAQQVLDGRPAAVVLGTTGSANTQFLKPFRALSPGTPVAGLSVALVNAELPKLGKATQGVAVTQVLPDPTSERTAVVRRYRAGLQGAGADAPVGNSSLEGWINAQVMIEGLRRAGPDLRREKLRTGLSSLRRLDLGDFVLGFAQAPFVASQFIDLAVLGADGRRMS